MDRVYEEERGHDNVLFAAACLLAAIGVVMVYSVSVGGIGNPYSPVSPDRALAKQLLAVGAGLVLCMFLASRGPRLHGAVVAGVFALVTLGLILVFVPGVAVTVDGRYHRWIRLGGGLTAQPSAFAPIALVLAIAWLGEQLHRDPDYYPTFRTLGIGAIALMGGLVMSEPDLGSTVLVTAVGLATLAVSGLRFEDGKRIGIVILGVLVLAVIGWDYMRERLIGFVTGHRTDTMPDQIRMSIMALGAGGLTGVGLGEGIAKFGYLPEARCDTILAAIGEEVGLRMTLAILLLYAIIAFRGFTIAARADSPTARAYAFGLTTMIALEALINTAVVTGVAPTTGVPLPFVSAGGTSAFAMLGAMGLILAGSRDSGSGLVEVTGVHADRPVERRNGRAYLPAARTRRVARPARAGGRRTR